jgi:hypothetical protein
MTKLFSYVLRVDDGAAPNPFHGVCTLTICKPAIRRTAVNGDWIVGLGSKRAKCNDNIIHDFSGQVVYAMKVINKMSLKEYDTYCQKSLPKKIPNWKAKEFELFVGDCIYDYSVGENPFLRKSVHNEANRNTDLGGINALLSDQFYYFGDKPKLLPEHLRIIIKSNQGHKKIEDAKVIQSFEEWISQFKMNYLYSDPQMKFIFNRNDRQNCINSCAKIRAEDIDETEETISPCK